jgi:phosphoadenosine phosphosulfate reductase
MTDAKRIIVEQLSGATAPCVTSSFQAESVVLLHMLHEVAPDIPVLFLDTFHHFPELLAYRDEIASRWRLNLQILRAAEPRPGLWRRDLDACCSRHKVEPLFPVLERHDLWLTGMRREQSPTRAALAEIAPFTLPSGKALTKVCPLASWTAREVWAYAKRHGIPLLPLYERGYTSIGCQPCTSLPLDPGNARSGRWDGRKLECGIHLEPVA